MVLVGTHPLRRFPNHGPAGRRKARSPRGRSVAMVLTSKLEERAFSLLHRVGAARPRLGQCRRDRTRSAAQASDSVTSILCAAHGKTLAQRRKPFGTRVEISACKAGQQGMFTTRVWHTDLASDRDAVLAMTVLERFEMAVVTSISACDSGGTRRKSRSPLGGVESHSGIWRR